MSIIRHEPGTILCDAVEHGNTVYLAGVVAEDLKQDVKGQTQQVVAEIPGENPARVPLREFKPSVFVHTPAL